ARFAPDAPLRRHRLLRLTPDPQQVDPPLLAQLLKLDEQILRFVLEEDSIDPRLASFAELREPSDLLDTLPLDADTRAWLSLLAGRSARAPVRLHLAGGGSGERRAVAEAIAAEAAAPLLTADLSRAVSQPTELPAAIDVLFREAWFQGAVLYVESIEALRAHDVPAVFASFLDRLAGQGGITVLGGTQPW